MGGGGWWWCLNVNLVIGFGQSLGLEFWPRAKPIKIWEIRNSQKKVDLKDNMGSINEF